MQHGTPSSSPVSLSLQTERERGGEIGEWEGEGETKRAGGKIIGGKYAYTHIFTCPARGKGGQGERGGGEKGVFCTKSTSGPGMFLEFLQ